MEKKPGDNWRKKTIRAGGWAWALYTAVELGTVLVLAIIGVIMLLF